MSLIQLRIPKQRRGGLVALARLTDDELDALAAVISKQPIRAFDIDLASRVAEEAKDISPDVAKDILQTVQSIYSPLFASQLSLKQFVDVVLKAFLAEASPGDEEKVDGDRLKRNLESLMRLAPLCLGAKAGSVLMENERIMMSNRILTDVRPVFSIDSDGVEGAVILHTLKIEYQSATCSEDSEFFIAVDDNDIDNLILSLKRAQSKAAQLKSVLAASNISLIEPIKP